MRFTAWPCGNPNIPACIAPATAPPIGIAGPVGATLRLAIPFSLTWHAGRFSTVRICCISRWLGKHRPDHVPTNPSANPCADDSANYRTYRPERRADPSPCVSAGQRVQSIGIYIANWIPAHIRVRVDAPGQPDGIGLDVAPPRRPSVVTERTFLRRDAGLRGEVEDGLPRAAAFCSRGTFWLMRARAGRHRGVTMQWRCGGATPLRRYRAGARWRLRGRGRA